MDAYDRNTVWEFLGEAREHLHMLGRDYMRGDMRCLSIDCQFLLTLTILRRNYGTVFAKQYLFLSTTGNQIQNTRVMHVPFVVVVVIQK